MTHHIDHRPSPEAASCGGAMEEALNLYMDGELPFSRQSALFAHLADCDGCRRTLAAMMEFRRMSRQEILAVPSAVDDAFLHRLDRVKRRAARVDRSADRRPLWQRRAPLSLRTVAAASLVLFTAGLLFPQQAGEVRPEALVEGQDEHIVLPEPVRYRSEAVYVFYPGLIIEATKLDERSTQEAL